MEVSREISTRNGYRQWLCDRRNRPDRSSFLFLLVFVAVTAAYLVLINVIGMTLATACYVTATVWQLNKRIVLALIVAVITAIIVHYVFSIGLEMNFPSGVFGN